MAVIVLLSVGLGWFGWKLREAERQRRAVEAIEEVGGYVCYDYQWDGYYQNWTAEPPAPAWLREWVGEDVLSHVVVIWLAGKPVGDEMLAHVQGLTNLEYLDLTSTQVTSQGIKELQEALPNCDIQWDDHP